jgi:hypothetical protein
MSKITFGDLLKVPQAFQDRLEENSQRRAGEVADSIMNMFRRSKRRSDSTSSSNDDSDGGSDGGGWGSNGW